MVYTIKFKYCGQFLDEVQVEASNEDIAQEMATDLIEGRLEREIEEV